jgi:transcriptional regulator with GAF, ATPase, and Fis domain
MGGTLFLDEIGDMPLELQPKLLRALQEQEFERLGSTQTVPVNARVVAATNQDLGQLVDKKLFRADLFYRLNVIPICLPPLRERVQYIIPLTEFFVAKCAARLNKPIDLNSR